MTNTLLFMAKNDININSDNITIWLASTGWIFPRTSLELARFDKLYSDTYEDLGDCRVNPDAIIANNRQAKVIDSFDKNKSEVPSYLRMAARKGDTGIPEHILAKIRKNQEKGKQDDNGSAEKGTE